MWPGPRHHTVSSDAETTKEQSSTDERQQDEDAATTGALGDSLAEPLANGDTEDCRNRSRDGETDDSQVRVESEDPRRTDADGIEAEKDQGDDTNEQGV
mgnify:CR=1 FL=1